MSDEVLVALKEEVTGHRNRLALVEETLRDGMERVHHVEGAQKDLADELLRHAKWIREVDERSLEATRRADATEHRVESLAIAMATAVKDGERHTSSAIAGLAAQVSGIPDIIAKAVAAEIAKAGAVVGASVSTAIATTKPAPARTSPSQRATRVAVVVMVIFEVLRELARMKGWGS